MKYDIFISYSRKDTAVADRICQALDRAGISYFIDRQGIGGGMEFPNVLAEAILESRLFLLLASRNSYDSKFTNSEINFAFNEKPRNSILPYIIDDSEMPAGMRLVFSSINWRNISQHPIDTVLVDDLLKLLHRPKSVKADIAPKPTEEEMAQWHRNARECEIKKNKKEAAEWMYKAAYHGYPPAQNSLAGYYEYGVGVEKDLKEAFKWRLQAAQQGYKDAQYQLALYYANGIGVVKDIEKAEQWLETCATGGSSLHQRNAADHFRIGNKIRQDYGKALFWYKEAITHDDVPTDVYKSLGDLYYKGLGVAQDYAAAARYYLNIADKVVWDHPAFRLGYMYSKGLGVKEDQAESVRWYKVAVDKGSVNAMFNLALKYEYGRGVAQDIPEAIRLYRLAADKGDEDAQAKLAKLTR